MKRASIPEPEMEVVRETDMTEAKFLSIHPPTAAGGAAIADDCMSVASVR